MSFPFKVSSSQLENIKNKLKQHHELYRFPVKGELWEDIFDQCINSPDESTWVPGGHDVGVDVERVSDGHTFQLKGGELNIKKGVVEWSGNRLTKHDTFNEKLEFISTKKADTHVLLSRNTREWKEGKKIYYLITFDSSLLTYDLLEWIETKNKKTGKHNGWKTVNCDELYADIKKSMSDQLWTTAKLNYLGNAIKIEI